MSGRQFITAPLNYIKLTSPGITLLVILTGFTGMYLAQNYTGKGNSSLFLWGLLGLGLASGGAIALNNYYDRDIDVLMERTKKRPIPSGRVSPKAALLFGAILLLLSLFIFFIFVNTLSALLVLITAFIYSFLYTVILKRRTPLATEIGGIAGALPPVIGWTSITGTLNTLPLLLFLILFFWQPPHFWALALRNMDDYRKARLPVLTLTHSEGGINLRLLIYLLLLLIASIIPYLSGMGGWMYLLSAIFGGVTFLVIYFLAFILKRNLKIDMFLYSVLYLSTLFVFLLIDHKNGGAIWQ